jgi:hypothetical protein
MSIDAPPNRNIAQEGSDTLKAQLELAPQQFAAEKQFRPQYNQLNRELLRDSLFGTGSNDPGYLDLASRAMPAISAQQRGATTAQRAADVADVASLGPQATEAFRAANPQQTRLVDAINAEAQSGLAYGAGLDPSLRREVTQATRQGFADRGLGQGPADIYAEATTRGQAGEQLRQQRYQRANQAVAVNQATSADPFQAILGRPANASASQAIGAAGMMGQGGATMFDPFSAYGADVANTNYNGQAAARIAEGNANSALIGAGISAAGSVGSSM